MSDEDEMQNSFAGVALSTLTNKLINWWHPVASAPPTVDLSELKLHSSAQDAWVVVDGLVYDITHYHKHHPGGGLLLGSAGRDVSAEFHSLHANNSHEKLKLLPCVGKLDVHLHNEATREQEEDEEKGIRQQFAIWATSLFLPCIGAKLAFSRSTWDLCVCKWELGSEQNSALVAQRLKDWKIRQQFEWENNNQFTTLIALFPMTPPRTDVEFEADMMAQLRSLRKLDTEPWPLDMPKDVRHEDYYYSVFGLSYFVLGLHPCSCRPGRRFTCASLVFNAKRQFDELQKSSQFSDIQCVVRKRDMVLSGAPNPCVVADIPAIQQASGYDHTTFATDWFPEL
ncbi:hypothetical protein J3458_020651 [Metarhizium acridum]|uniref:uncharacterized protein n=1 Tax=Metarhizium acridum TaxID=92637 RepID=UPI001C6B8D2C|nr:hypothetical protein J3458_020651 [Metarhizium acridum]